MGKARPGLGGGFRGLDLHQSSRRRDRKKTKTVPNMMTEVNSQRLQVRGIGQSTTSDIRLSGPPSGQGAGGEARTRNRRVSVDLRGDSLATVPLTPQRE
ncbi:hypothetical protein PoB_006516500 [Plakobranchus ocellatus]|uniref:Uncharacterized protein n=1 Tax=Plakobranchus ocellatus TaxID=259542 RepID=A0AAV4D3I6_9GAST|nr:hypothetical protein PoB_006516500 [Plakobranchus ocellatus]